MNKTGKSDKVQRDLWQCQRGCKKQVKTVRHPFGGTDEMTPDDARSWATAMLDLIKRGIDPNAPPPGRSAGAGGWIVRRILEEYGADRRTRNCVERPIDVHRRSMKRIVRGLHVSRNAVCKILRSDETDFGYARTHQPMPRIGPWQDRLDRLLAANAGKPSRERLTLVRMFEALRAPGYLRMPDLPCIGDVVHAS